MLYRLSRDKTNNLFLIPCKRKNRWNVMIQYSNIDICRRDAACKNNDSAIFSDHVLVNIDKTRSHARVY